jgi:hypothetical protein
MRHGSAHAMGFGLALLMSIGSNAVAQDATPRALDGHPDLTGIWDNGGGITHVQPVQIGETFCIRGCEKSSGPRPAPDRPRYREEFVAKVRDLEARQVEEDPGLRCMPPGVPRIGPPDKIAQLADQVIFLYEDYSGNYFRIIPTDGRPHADDVPPSFLGDSIGRWEGDELVVDVTNFNDLTWLTDDGAFHTTDLRVVERLSREGDTLNYRATAYDPAVLAEPWELRPRTATLTDLELIESPPCLERDLANIVDGSHHDNPR